MSNNKKKKYNNRKFVCNSPINVSWVCCVSNSIKYPMKKYYNKYLEFKDNKSRK